MDNYKSENYINFINKFLEKIQYKIKNKIYLRFKNLILIVQKKIDIDLKEFTYKKI